MNQFPCINPTCTHLFSATELSGSVLKCPKCGQEIQVRAGAGSSTQRPPAASPVAQTPPPASKPRVQPPPTPLPPYLARPVATPVAALKPGPPGPPQAMPVASPVMAAPTRPGPPVASDDQLADLASPSPISVRRRTPASRSWVTLAAVAFILVGGALAVILAIRRFRAPEEDNPVVYEGPIIEQNYEVKNFENKPERVFKIVLPKDKKWDRKEVLRKKLDAQAGWWDDEGKLHFLVAVSDFGLRKPRDAELVRTGMDLLYKLYEETLEAEQMPKKSKIAGQSAQKLEFKGRDGAVVHWGELHFFSRHGLAYWVILAGPDLKTCQETLQWLEEKKLGMAIVDGRAGWTEQPPPMETFVGFSGAVSLTAPEGVYQKQDRPKEKEVEAASDLYLLGRHLKKKDNTKIGHVQVFLLDPELNLDDAMTKAREHVVAQWAGGEGALYKLALSPEAEEGMDEKGKTIAVGTRSGRIADFAKIVDGKAARLVVIGVVNDAGRLYLITCDVVWDNRQIWHQEFHDLVKSLKILKGGGT